MKNDWWKRLVLIWDNASYHVSLMIRNYINAQKEDWLTIIYIPKKAPYLNPNERKVNQQIKSHVCANRYTTFHCFIYFHKLTTQTLHRLLGIYLPRKIAHIKERSRIIENALTNARKEANTVSGGKFQMEMEFLNDQLSDVEKFDRDVKMIIENGYTPLNNEGIYVNIKPLEKLLDFQTTK